MGSGDLVFKPLIAIIYFVVGDQKGFGELVVRQGVKIGEVKVAQESQADGSGNGSGGDGDLVGRIGEGREKRSLSHTEFMLFVNN